VILLGKSSRSGDVLSGLLGEGRALTHRLRLRLAETKQIGKEGTLENDLPEMALLSRSHFLQILLWRSSVGLCLTEIALLLFETGLRLGHFLLGLMGCSAEL